MGFSITWLSSHLTIDLIEVIPETHRAHQIIYLRLFFYYKWVDTSADRLLDPEYIIVPVVTVSALFLLKAHVLFTLFVFVCV